jgi:hypothetical protein
LAAETAGGPFSDDGGLEILHSRSTQLDREGPLIPTSTISRPYVGTRERSDTLARHKMARLQ